MTDIKQNFNPENLIATDFTSKQYLDANGVRTADSLMEEIRVKANSSAVHIDSTPERYIEPDAPVRNNKQRKNRQEATRQGGGKASEVEVEDFLDENKNRCDFDFWQEGIDTLQATFGERIKLTRTHDSTFGMLDIAFQAQISYGTEAQEHHGLKVPRDAKKYKSITSASEELNGAFRPMLKDTARFWQSYTKSYAGAVSQYAKIADPRTIALNKSVSYQGNCGHKVVPALDWFSPEIQQLDPMALLTPIMGEPEAKTTMMHIGRIATGAPVDKTNLAMNGDPGAKTVESLECTTNYALRHRVSYPNFHYRVMYVLTGEPEVGKSTLWEYINTAFAKCGYTRGIFAQSFNQFNWSGAVKDILFCEDMSRESTIKMQLGTAASTLKSVVSGGDISIEPKGVDAMMARSKAAVVFLANNIEFPKKNQIDDGIANRIHFLQCKPKSVMLAEGTKSLGEAWKQLAESMDTTPEVLTLYLIRRSLDMFLEKNGYTWVAQDDGTYGYYQYNPEQVTAREFLEQNKLMYSFQPPVDLTKVLTEACRKTLLFSTIGKQDLPFEFDEGFHVFHLYHLAETLVTLRHRITECAKFKEFEKVKMYERLYSYIAPQGILASTWEKFKIILERSIASSGNKTMEDLWVDNVENLTTTEGATAPKVRKWSHADYTQAKQSAKGYSFAMEQLAKELGFELDFLGAILSIPFRALV